MRIALISLARRGGMVHFHAELANALNKIIPETIAITSLNVPSSYYSYGILRLVVNIGRGAAGTLFNVINPFSWFKLYQQLQASQADVFHIVSSHEWNPLLVQLIKMMGKPLVFTMHDPEHHLGAPFYMRISDRFVMRRTDAIIVLSQLGNEQMLAKGITQDKIFRIPLGVFSSFLQWRSNKIRQEKILLFFGRIEPYKGLDLLLSAFFLVTNDLPGWKLVIAGNGDLSPYASDLLHPQIEVINKFIPDEEVAVLMERSRFVVLPYSEATQSGVIPVAYAFGRPVIATDVGSLREMVIHGKTGFLIPPGNLEELIRAIKTLAVDDLLCRRLGQFAFELGREEWSWERIARMHFDVYSKLVEKFV